MFALPKCRDSASSHPIDRIGLVTLQGVSVAGCYSNAAVTLIFSAIRSASVKRILEPRAVLTCVRMSAAVFKPAPKVGFDHEPHGLRQSLVEFACGACLRPTKEGLELRTVMLDVAEAGRVGHQPQDLCAMVFGHLLALACTGYPKLSSTTTSPGRSLGSGALLFRFYVTGFLCPIKEHLTAQNPCPIVNFQSILCIYLISICKESTLLRRMPIPLHHQRWHKQRGMLVSFYLPWP
jgi:hypothetical protein